MITYEGWTIRGKKKNDSMKIKKGYVPQDLEFGQKIATLDATSCLFNRAANN